MLKSAWNHFEISWGHLGRLGSFKVILSIYWYLWCRFTGINLISSKVDYVLVCITQLVWIFIIKNFDWYLWWNLRRQKPSITSRRFQMTLFSYVSTTGLARIDFTNLKCFSSFLGLVLVELWRRVYHFSLPETVKSMLVDIQSYDDTLTGFRPGSGSGPNAWFGDPWLGDPFLHLISC